MGAVDADLRDADSCYGDPAQLLLCMLLKT